MKSMFEEFMYLYILEIYSFYNYKIRVLNICKYVTSIEYISI